jgi:asparagine synthase (glutamine-hydrolysing)
MCGIVACYHFDGKPVNQTDLWQMTNQLTHRGPDDSGVWCQENVGLGHRRLSIIDLSSAGRGPMSNVGSTRIVTYNGEIYNFQQVRSELESKGYVFRTKTDTEVILHAYTEWGVDCLSRFNGMFAFALWDADQQCMFVARDRFGIKPLVYYYDVHRFVCASELKALLADPTIPREFDPVAFHHYLSLLMVPAPFTIYKDIRKLLPGHYLLIKDNRVVQHRWWQLSLQAENTQPEADALAHLQELLTDSVRLRLISDAPVGAFLSGGVDSSLISALAARQLAPEQLRTFSVTFLGDKKYDESQYACKVAKQINSKHTEIDLQPDFLEILPDVVKLYDEPFAVSSALATYLMARATSQYVTVILTGDGGDEVFGGYKRHTWSDQKLDRINRLPFSGLRRLNKTVPQSPPPLWEVSDWQRKLYTISVAFSTPDDMLRTWRQLNTIQMYNEREKFSLYTPEWAAELRNMSDFSTTYDYLAPHLPADAPNNLARQLYLDIHTNLPDHMLTKVDKATMAWGLEARTPFLDYRLVDFALSLPEPMMVQKENQKRLLKLVAEQYVPRDVLYRKKQGFVVPLSAWFRESIPPLLTDSLSEVRLRNSGIFRPGIVKKIIARHQKDPRVDLSSAILMLAWYELWKSNG